MIRVLFLAAALATASPVFAQTAPAPAERPDAASAAEAEFEAKAEAFEERLQTMQDEMQAAVTEHGADAAGRDAALDAIQARYQPDVDAFATDLEAFVNTQAAGLPEAQAAEMRSGIAAALPSIRSIPQQARTAVVAAGAAAATGS